jgi:hypothetical protein
MIAYKKRADECRRLAKLTTGSEHWVAFLEMAETWDKLADFRELSGRLRASGVLLPAPAQSDHSVQSSAAVFPVDKVLG